MQVLNGWKEISSYLGRGIRTVQRWERSCGLPVRRPDEHGGAVLAISSELDAWLNHTSLLSETAPPTRLKQSGELLQHALKVSSLNHALVSAIEESLTQYRSARRETSAISRSFPKPLRPARRP